MPKPSQFSNAKFDRFDKAIRKAMDQNTEAWSASKDPKEIAQLAKDYDELWVQRRELHEQRVAYVASQRGKSEAEKELAEDADGAKDWVDKVKTVADVLKTVGVIGGFIGKLAKFLTP